MSRPLFVATDQQRQLVRSLAAFGIRHEEIAGKLDISPKTLRKHFRTELDHGATDANAQVARTLFKMATDGKNPAATIFWLKSRAGWRQSGGGRGAQEMVPFVVEVIQGPESSK